MQKEINISTIKSSLVLKIKSYAELMKLRLSSLVVLSAMLGYFLAPGVINNNEVLLLCFGGFLITGASNAFNQIWEKELDKLMSRTQKRPLPQGRVSVLEGILVGATLGILGITLLWLLNNTCAILGILALVIYVAVYTPLKIITPFAVFVGAIPGSIPPMLGYVAATGSFGLEAGVLFMIQFFWQFPHFWAIAWKLDDDYKKAGFRLLPSGKRDKQSAYQIMLYSAFLIPVSMLPWAIDLSGIFSMFLAVFASIIMTFSAIKLYRKLEMKYAKQLMYYSFFYLPFLLFIYFLDKL